MSYATLVQFKAAVKVEDTVDDTDIQRALDAASEWIENYTGRVFGTVGASEQRVYDPVDERHLAVPDLATVSAVALDTHQDGTFSTALPATAYQLYPLNIGQPGVRGNYREIRIRPTAVMGFWQGRQVRVTGTFGYGSTPTSIVQACILLANRYFRRPSAAFGIQEAPQSGALATVPESDPDVVSLLSAFGVARNWVAV